MPRLSKSRLNAFRQCAKRMWLEVHRPELTLPDPSRQRLFDVGHQVGTIAQQQYPDGVLIAPDNDLTQALADTPAALAARRPVFEATFEFQDVLVRTDLLLPDEDGWHMAEVKSTTTAKDVHLPDLAVQVWAARNCGVSIRRASVRHINNGFTLTAHGDYRGLLVDTDRLSEVEGLLSGLPRTIAEAQATLAGPEPDIRTGGHCSDPYECQFQSYCAAQEPPQPNYPVTVLPGPKGKSFANALLSEGFSDLARVPRQRLAGASELIRRIHEATVTGVPYHDAAGAAAAMADWAWPRYFLDFETIAPAVPVWVGTQPYKQTPFQFSLHVQQAAGTLTHRMFLDLTGEEPSRACAEALLSSVGPEGAVIAYNATFEKGCITALASRHDDLADRLHQIADRLVDPLPVVRTHYYHPDMHGSFSLKAVQPVLAPHLDYTALPVRDGDMAQLAYLEATSPGCTAERKAQIAEDLAAYCDMDTLAMVDVVRALGMR